jgi:hypothetical protein
LKQALPEASCRLIGRLDSGINGFIPVFRLVFCFLHGKMKSFELDLGSKPRNQHETSPDLPDREGEGVYYLHQNSIVNMGRTKAESRNLDSTGLRSKFITIRRNSKH